MNPQDLKAAILGAEDRQVVSVKTPEWPVAEVFVRPLSGVDRDWVDQMQSEKRFPDEGSPDWRGIRAGICSRGMCDAAGASLGFTEAEVLALGDKNGAALDRIYRKIRDISGLAYDAVEDAEKN